MTSNKHHEHHGVRGAHEHAEHEHAEHEAFAGGVERGDRPDLGLSSRPDPDLSAALEQDVTAGEIDDVDEALVALLESGLLLGPDPTILEDVKGSPDPKPYTPHSAALTARVNQIYNEIITRAPEHKVQPSLERVERALALLGDPQHDYRSIHITGTNAKTSTARMIEALLREQGLRTGRFTSPHLSSVRERIAIDGLAISEADFVDTWDEIEPVIELVDEWSQAQGGPKMSFFEVFTVMAYAAFSVAPIDVAVIEVGMGGRWDATNVIRADVAVLGPVALDHQRWLGSSVQEIAAEKLGIVKEGSVVVSAAQAPQVMELLNQTVAQQRAELLLAGRDFHVIGREAAVGGQLVSVKTPAATYEDVPVAMLGAFQSENAALALTAVEAFLAGRALGAEVVEHALMSTRSPGRIEVVKASPLVIVDGGHNPHAVQATVQALDETFPGPRVAVYSAMADKDIEAVLSVMEPAFAAVVLTQMEGERAAEIEDLQAIALEIFGEDRVRVEPDLGSAITTATDIAETLDPDAVTPASVTVMGSIMLAAQAREILGARRVDDE